MPQIRTVADDPDTFLPDESFWKKAKIVTPQKQPITIRLDEDVLDFFKGQNPKGYQQRINSVLRSFMETEINQHS